jgi:hypothetical protein
MASRFFTPVIFSIALFQYFTFSEPSRVVTPSGRLSIMFSLNSLRRASCLLASASSCLENLRVVVIPRMVPSSSPRSCSV